MIEVMLSIKCRTRILRHQLIDSDRDKGAKSTHDKAIKSKSCFQR